MSWAVILGAVAIAAILLFVSRKEKAKDSDHAIAGPYAADDSGSSAGDGGGGGGD